MTGDLDTQLLADSVLWVATPLWLWFGVVYIVFEKAGGWVRWGLILAVIGVAQMLVRSCLSTLFGEDWALRSHFLLIGRIELLASGVILVTALHVLRGRTKRDRRNARLARRRENAISGPSSPSADR